RLACFVPGATVRGVQTAGACHGTFGLAEGIAEGLAAGAAAARAAGFRDGKAPRAPSVDTPLLPADPDVAPGSIAPLWLVPPPAVCPGLVRPPRGPRSGRAPRSGQDDADPSLARRPWRGLRGRWPVEAGALLPAARRVDGGIRPPRVRRRSTWRGGHGRLDPW